MKTAVSKKFLAVVAVVLLLVVGLFADWRNASHLIFGTSGDVGIMRTGAAALSVTNGGDSFSPTLGSLAVLSLTQGQTPLAVPRTAKLFNGATSTGITDTAFTIMAATAEVPIPAGAMNVANKHLRIIGKGVYTTGAASLLNADLALCTVSGCATGTTVAPAGCVVTSTNQANVLANGQFTFVCDLDTVTTGASGTLMAKASGCFNLGSATSVVSSCFQDTSTAASAAVDLTVAEYANLRFKFSTSNASNAVVLHVESAEFLN
jgi:hypothetical protein